MLSWNNLSRFFDRFDTWLDLNLHVLFTFFAQQEEEAREKAEAKEAKKKAEAEAKAKKKEVSYSLLLSNLCK